MWAQRASGVGLAKDDDAIPFSSSSNSTPGRTGPLSHNRRRSVGKPEAQATLDYIRSKIRASGLRATGDRK